jgi:ABC-type transport system substrate-binding protein
MEPRCTCPYEKSGLADALMAATEELSVPDDRTVRFRLKRPFPHLPEALAGPGGIVPAVMRHFGAQHARPSWG